MKRGIVCCSPSLNYVVPREKSSFRGCGNICNIHVFVRPDRDGVELWRRRFGNSPRCLPRGHCWPHKSSMYPCTCILPSLVSLPKSTPRVFSVHISDAPSLAKLLPLLPSLDTLEVLSGDYPEPSIEHSFQSVKLPQIRTLVISPSVQSASEHPLSRTWNPSHPSRTL